MPSLQHRFIRRSAATAALLLLVGCASTQLDNQWTDPAFAQGGLLRGARVLVACEAYDPVIKQLCEERLADELSARGATPLRLAQAPAGEPGRPVADELYLGAARAQQARAALVVNVAPSELAARSGSGVSIGLGGFGIGGSSHVGAGVGVSVPLGGTAARSGYSAGGRLSDTASGRLVWSARASTPASSDLSAQVGELSRAVADAAAKAGLF
jgi:hypothetical protein